MYTIVGSPTHVIPVQIQAPALKDPLGSAQEFRRQWTRSLRAWELIFPGTRDMLEELAGLIDYAQGDIPLWFDGADTLEVVQPILIGVGNGSQTDFNLPHKHVFVASAVVYLNGGAVNTWAALGGDGITMDKIRLNSAPGNYSQIKAKYRRKAKVVLNTDDAVEHERNFRNRDHSELSVYRFKYLLSEIAT